MASEPIRLGGVPEHVNLPWHVAMASPELVDLDLRWEDQLGGTGQMLEGLADGSLDLVSILTEGTVSAIAAGLEATIVQVYTSSPLQWGVYVPASSSRRSIEDLAGAPIAISRHRSGSHLMAFVLATEQGWGDDELSFVVTGGLDGARASFAAGESEVFLWDRFMTRPLVEVGEFRQVGVVLTPWPSFVIAARTEVLLDRTTEVGRVVDRVVAEGAGLATRPGVTAEVAERYWLTPEIVEEWLAATTFAPRSAFDPAIATEVLDTLRQAGFTDG